MVVFGKLRTDLDNQGVLARPLVRFAIAHVIQIEYAHAEQANGKGGKENGEIEPECIQKIAAAYTEEPKEKKNEKVSESTVTIGILAYRIFDRRVDAAQTEKQKQKGVSQVLHSKGPIDQEQGHA